MWLCDIDINLFNIFDWRIKPRTVLLTLPSHSQTTLRILTTPWWRNIDLFSVQSDVRFRFVHSDTDLHYYNYREIRSAFSDFVSPVTYLNICHHWVAASKHWTHFHTVKNSKLRFNNFHLLIMCNRKDKRLLTSIFCCSYSSPTRRTKSSKYFIKLRLDNHNSIRNIITQIMKFISREISITSSIKKFKILNFLREKLTYIFNWGNNLRIDKIGITFINLFKIFLYFGLILFNYFHIFTNEILEFGLLVRDSKELQVLYDMALIYFLKFRVLN